MKRYITIYKQLLVINFANFITNRINFFNSIISSAIWSIFGIVSILLLTSRTSSVLGWTRSEILLLAAIYNIIFSIFYCFFSENFEELPLTIHLGRLDGLLLKPMNTQFLISAYKFGFHNIIRFTIGILFLLYLLQSMHIQITFLHLSLFIFICFLSIIIIYSLWFLVMTTTIWFSELQNLPEFMFAVQNVTRYPGEIYKNFSFFLYLLFFPLTLVATVPVRAITGKLTLTESLAILLTAGILFYLSQKFFHFALRFYTNASG